MLPGAVLPSKGLYMRWNVIKTVMIVLLAVVNICLAVSVIISYRNINYINADVKREAIELLADGGLFVSEDKVPDKKPRYNVIECEYSEGYSDEYLNYLTGGLEYSSYVIPSGEIRYFINDTSDIFEYSYPFGLRYKRGGIEPDLNVFDTAESNQSKHKEAEKAVRQFIYPNSSAYERGKSEMDIELTELYSGGGMYRAFFYQTYSQKIIAGTKTEAVIDGGKVIYLSGSLIFPNDVNRYSTDLYDQINILFLEKRRIAEENENGAEAVNVTVDSMKCGYIITWNNKMTKYYLIPAWIVKYNGGNAIIRNAVIGDIYEK